MKFIGYFALIVFLGYCLIAVTPLKRQVVRLDPGLAKYFHPPFFHFVEDFDSGSVGLIDVGQSIVDAETAIQSRYGERPSYGQCAPTEGERKRVFTPDQVCFEHNSSLWVYPIKWIITVSDGRIAHVRVFTVTQWEL
jgi:hypothetical protein